MKEPTSLTQTHGAGCIALCVVLAIETCMSVDGIQSQIATSYREAAEGAHVPHVDLSEVIKEDGSWDNLHPTVREALTALPFWYPDEAVDDDNEIYARALRGHCMTCDGQLKDLTMLCLNQAGIVMIYCSGACYTDMQVTGWLEEKYEDLVDTIKFRGGRGDTPEA